MPFRSIIWRAGQSLLALCVLGATLAGFAAPVSAAGPAPLGTGNFNVVAPEGFGNRNNSWTWAMQWWPKMNKLYVGTNKSFGCASALSLAALNLGTYPPNSPYMVCNANPSLLDLAAEIWAWDPTTSIWTKVFESPNNIPNPDPSYPGTFLPPDIGFRTATEFINPYEAGSDSGGTDTMCFGGVTAEALGFGSVPPPRILCTTDGLNFNPIPQGTGTFMGTLPQASMRGLTFWNNQLWVVNGTFQGNGPIIASLPGQDPLGGNNSWTYAVQTGGTAPTYYDIKPYNGYLYTCEDIGSTGYAVAKTTATGSPPYTWSTVMGNGGYLPNPSSYCLSMSVFNSRLYVGTAGPAEQIRINADDTWDLVMGTPRQTPTGQWLYPLTGFSEGFDNNFNLHVYRMASHNGQLYSGTYDSSVRQLPSSNTQLVAQISPGMGADLYQTADGWYVRAMTLTGFGDGWDYAIRNFQDTPFGLFVGTLNEFYGLDIYRGLESASPAPIVPPTRLMGETSNGQSVLTWDPVANATQYLIYSTPMTSISSNGTATTVFPSAVWSQVGATADTVFADQPPPSGSLGFEYYVVAVDGYGNQSDASNLIQMPEVTPAMTFSTALSYVQNLQQRGVFAGASQSTTAYNDVQLAQQLAVTGNDAAAMDTLKALDQQATSGALINAAIWPDGTDLDVVIGKLMRRLKLVESGFIAPSSL